MSADGARAPALAAAGQTVALVETVFGHESEEAALARITFGRMGQAGDDIEAFFVASGKLADLERKAYASRGNGEAPPEDVVEDVVEEEPRRRYPDPPEAAFYGVLGDLVRTIEPHSEADPVAVLIQAVTYFGNLIGRGPHLVAEARRHYTNLFACVVGPTAKARKGSSQGQVERVFRHVDEEWAKARVTAGLSSGEGLIWSVRDPIERTEPIKEKGRVVDYQTVVADPGIADKRVLFAEEELSGVLSIMGRQGNSLSPTIRKAWDTGNLNTVVKNNAAKATDAHVSITGHTTRDELLRNLEDTEKANGFANRFLWVCARRSKMLPFGGRLRDEDLVPVVQRLREAVDFARKLGETCVGWEAEAAQLWRDVYPELSAGRSGLLGAVTSRAEAQTIRLALVYAVADCSRAICRPHLEAALALWSYCYDSAKFIFGDALGDPVADEVLAMLRRAAGGMTRNELRDAFGRHKTAADLGRALAMLAEQGLARSEKESTGGRPVTRWFALLTRAISAESAERSGPAGEGSGLTAHTALSAQPNQPKGARL